jgi:membrane protease YdiL (CAAX protease family)
VSRARLACWIALISAVSALEYSARFSSTTTRNARDDVYSYSAFVNGLIFYGLILGVVLAIAFDRTDLFALRRPARRAAQLAAAVLIATYLWELVVVLLPIRDPGNEQGLTPTHWESSHAGAFAVNLVLFCVVAPAVEELTFRGVGQSLLRFTGRWPSILLVGIAFGLWHGLLQALLILIPFGVGLAYLRDRTRSVIPGMVVHALFNGAALAFAVLS